MGLFSFNYAKPGPGVDPDAPEKKGFFRFWEIIFEKFSKLLGANALHAALSIPCLLILYLIAPVSTEWVQNFVAGVAENAGDVDAMAQNLMLTFRTVFAVGIFMLWGSGPSSAMYAYITRCFTRRDPVWVISDGFDKFKENFKQAIVVAIIDVVVIVLGYNAIWFYYSTYKSQGNMIWMFLCSLMVMMSVVYTWMHFYIYQLMVTFKCTLKQLYKNAALFAIAMLPINLFLTILNAVIIIGLFTVLNPMFAILLDLIVLAVFLRFPIEFTASRKINKLLLQNREKTMPEKKYIHEDGRVTEEENQ